MSVINREDAIKALEDVSAMYPYRIQGVAETYRSYNEAWNDAIDEAEKAIEALPDADDGWISCKDRLPKKGQVVLWCNDDGNSFTSAITYEREEYWAIGNRHRGSRVIAWRPLPPAFRPKEDKC